MVKSNVSVNQTYSVDINTQKKNLKKLTEMSPREKMIANLKADLVNKKVGTNKMGDSKGKLGKNSFLKLLVTQLKHQDPTKPLEDKEFIAQMAQFSTLEQMSNIHKDFSKLLKSSKATEANTFLGKNIDAFNPKTNQRISGKVDSIRYHNNEVVLVVGKQEVQLKDVHAVHNNEKNSQIINKIMK